MLPAGDDPDNFIRKHGGAAYQENCGRSRPYLDYLLDRAAPTTILHGRRAGGSFLTRCSTVAARIPDAAARDQFADRLAHKARITEEVVRPRSAKAAVQRETVVTPAPARPALGQVKPAERA